MRSFDMRKAHITILILLSGMFAAGLMVPSSTAEIYKYVDKAGGVHQPNIPDVNYGLEMKESWVRFQPGADFMVPSSTAEIYKYVDKDGVVHLTNVPDGKYNLVLKESWLRFQPEAEFERYDTAIWKAAEKYRVDYALVKAVIKAESNFNPQAVSRAGAKGLMQLMPGTANALGVDNSFHPEDNIQGGVRHLRYLLDRFKGDMHLALAAYNSGEKVVFRYKGIPPYKETRTYIRRVLRYFHNYSSELSNPDFL